MQLPLHLFGLVWVPVLFHIGLSQDNCRVQDGKPGQAGIPGRDGRPGQKGEKGEPVLQVKLSKEELIGLKGDQGEEGLTGKMGPRGYNGILGPPGPAGLTGPPGPYRGDLGSGASDAMKAAFSVVRSKGEQPKYTTPLIFDKSLTNVNNNFDVVTGEFTCSVPGIYYFVFHAVAEDDLCLQLRSNSNDNLSLTFCDFNLRKTSQVLSGGVVIELEKNSKVWLEPTKNSEHRADPNKKPEEKPKLNQLATKIDVCVFNGFLIFATSN